MKKRHREQKAPTLYINLESQHKKSTKQNQNFRKRKLFLLSKKMPLCWGTGLSVRSRSRPHTPEVLEASDLLKKNKHFFALLDFTHGQPCWGNKLFILFGLTIDQGSTCPHHHPPPAVHRHRPQLQGVPTVTLTVRWRGSVALTPAIQLTVAGVAAVTDL